MKKRIYIIHKWLGLTLGGILFILALSGTVITFTHELLPKLYSSYFVVTPDGQTLPLKTLAQNARNYLGPDRMITNFYAAEDADEAPMVFFKDPSKSFPSLLTINPYNGKIIGEMPLIKNIFAVMLFVHANLLLGKTGKYLVGIMGILLVFFILSGIYVWWPKKEVINKLKKTLRIADIALPQRFHHFFGLILAVPLFISAVTGYLTVFDNSYSIGRLLRNDPVRLDEMEKPGTCAWEDQLKALDFVTPEMEKNLISIHFCSAKNSYMKVSHGLHDQAFVNGYARLVIDPKTQTILQNFNSEKDPQSWNYKRLTVFPIHSGEYFGMPGRILVFLGGLGLMGLFISGVVLTIKRRSVRKQISSHRPTEESL